MNENYVKNDGYIPLFRKSLRSQVFQNPHLWKMWCWCLLKASHKARWVTMKTGQGDIQVEIEEGQFIFGRESAARELRMRPSSVRNRIVKLSKLRNLDVKSDRQFSIVTICNWKVYKELMFGDRTGNRTGKGQAKDTDNNVNNVKNEESALTLIRTIIEEYKRLKGYDKQDDWDRNHFKRHVRAAKDLYEKGGEDWQKAMEWASQQEYCDWTLETVIKKLPDFRAAKDKPRFVQP